MSPLEEYIASLDARGEWLEAFLVRTDLMLADARVLRWDRMQLRVQLQRIFGSD